ncbi:hypothetical protein [Ornithinibacillus massiliensis]|uniref:hypothetical protein n=1 Tax=Ornithinibacillus massiliensis TaxID=1944633 RepID=UPI003CCE8DB4
MKRIFWLVLLAALLFMISACSAQDENHEDHHSASDENTGTESNPSDESESEEKASTSTPDSADGGFDVESYLNEHYAMENLHYVAEAWEDAEVDKMNYTVNILPDTKEFGQEIDAIFKSGSPNVDDERTIEMFAMAEKIMDDMPTIDETIHIDSVNWVSYDGSNSIMLIQDYENSNVQVGNQGGVLTQYSSEQIEYARVWLQLGPNQDIEGLNVHHIPAGTPINPNDETSVSYPEDVIQLAGSRLVDGSVTYSGNGDGTINIYNVPLRWDGQYPAGEKFYTDIIDNTALVYIDPGSDEKVAELIKLLQVSE